MKPDEMEKAGERIPCRRCLLSELSDETLYLQVKKAAAVIPEKERCSEEEYQKRLLTCKECDSLLSGTCLLCGCYVEIRAAKKSASCPAPGRKW